MEAPISKRYLSYLSFPNTGGTAVSSDTLCASYEAHGRYTMPFGFRYTNSKSNLDIKLELTLTQSQKSVKI